MRVCVVIPWGGAVERVALMGMVQDLPVMLVGASMCEVQG